MNHLKILNNLKPYYMILLFYCIIIFLTSTGGFIINKKDGFTNGMIFGFIISMVLWFQYGIKMI